MSSYLGPTQAFQTAVAVYSHWFKQISDAKENELP